VQLIYTLYDYGVDYGKKQERLFSLEFMNIKQIVHSYSQNKG